MNRSIFRMPAAAMRRFLEPLVWREDRSPHRTGTVLGAVTHGAGDSSLAGHPLGEITADPYVVTLDEGVALAASVRVGDTLCRVGCGITLSVQQINKSDTGWMLVCSAKERVNGG